jgi:hypothetical protein
VLAGPATLKYLKCFEVPITFDRSDNLDFIPRAGRYPLIVSPIVMDVKFNYVLIDGGSSLNIHFLKAFDQMGLPMLALRSFTAPFHGVLSEPRPPPSVRSSYQ